MASAVAYRDPCQLPHSMGDRAKAASCGHRQTRGMGRMQYRLDRIPPDGEIAVIKNGAAIPPTEVRRSFHRFLSLARLSAEGRGWTTLTLAIIRELRKPSFTLNELYDREHRFAEAYPGNRHVRAKIRQQLQVLRNIGVLDFEGGGAYRLIALPS